MKKFWRVFRKAGKKPAVRKEDGAAALSKDDSIEAKSIAPPELNTGLKGIYTGTRQRGCAVNLDFNMPLKQAVKRKYLGF